MKMVTRIKEYRAKNNMTQEDLATIVGVRRETIVHLENGRYNPSLKLAFTIAKVFDATIEDLFTFTEE
ncbi:MAG TPA: transcriptional regulator [Anaerolineaceae bacterium]|nr:transcriptional regulator [Anaerolineaceae bacterium]